MYHSRDMANARVFFRQTDGQAKNYMPPVFKYGGIKFPSSIEVPTIFNFQVII
jgi:hypothetical protein